MRSSLPAPTRLTTNPFITEDSFEEEDIETDGIQLLPKQLSIVEKIENLMSCEPIGAYKFPVRGCFLTSRVGTGKSYMVCGLAERNEYNIAVICSLTVQSTWEKMRDICKVPINIFNYTGLHTKSSGDRRLIDVVVKNGKETYQVTETARQVFSVPTIVVFDEFQELKNKTKKYEMCKTLIDYFLSDKAQKDNANFFLALSAFPVAVYSHIITHLELFKFIPRDAKSPVNAFENFCRNLFTDREEAFDRVFEEYVQKYSEDFEDDTVENHILALCGAFFVPNFTFSIDDCEPEGGVTLSSYDAYIKVSDANQEKIDTIIKIMEEHKPIVREGSGVGKSRVKSVNDDSGIFGKSLACLECLKLEAEIFLIDRALEQPHRKVIVFCNYIQNMINLVAHYQERGIKVLALYGDIKVHDRGAIINAFNSPDDEYRLLICNILVGGAGISLHDIHGGFPRTTLLSNIFSIGDILQGRGRTWRIGTKSDVEIIKIHSASKEEIFTRNHDAKNKVIRHFIHPDSRESVKKFLLNTNEPLIAEYDGEPIEICDYDEHEQSYYDQIISAAKIRTDYGSQLLTATKKKLSLGAAKKGGLEVANKKKKSPAVPISQLVSNEEAPRKVISKKVKKEEQQPAPTPEPEIEMKPVVNKVNSPGFNNKINKMRSLIS